ncbi:MAG: hypothetical protein KKH97_02215 [Proteobacteria bacterium]|nr:hypothetical protein [Pseudomonadota bacterium]
MKSYRTGKNTLFLPVLAAILLLTLLWLPAPGLALMALPDIGIDYPTMKVKQADKLVEAGMKNVKNGDTITMRSSPKDGKIIFRNLRTNEELAYPSDGQKGKEK